MWIFFALVSVLTDSFSNLFRRLLMRGDKSDPYAYAIMFQIALAVITGVYTWYKGLIIFPYSNLYLNLVFTAVLYGMGTLLYFKAAKKIEASEISILMALGSIVSILLGILLLKEAFGFIKIIGVVLILFSVILLNTKKGLKLNSGTIFAAGAAILYGIAVVNDTFILRTVPAIAYLPICSLLPGLFLLIMRPQIYKRIYTVFASTNSLRNLFLLCFFYSIQGLAYFLALENKAPISQMGPVGKSSIIITVLLATIFLKERKHLLKKAISTGLVTVGVLLLIT